MFQIDCETILLLGEEGLKEFLPKFGDRVAVINFSKKKIHNTKKSLTEKLREKILNRKTNKDEKEKSQNINIQCSKKTRIVEIGWVCSQQGSKVYTQVRTKYGGGTRRISVSKEAKCSELLERAKELFFPNGVSTKGLLSEFNCELLDFKSHSFSMELTVQQMYEISAMSTLRFYLATTYKNKEYNHTPRRSTISESSSHYNLRSSFVQGKLEKSRHFYDNNC